MSRSLFRSSIGLLLLSSASTAVAAEYSTARFEDDSPEDIAAALDLPTSEEATEFSENSMTLYSVPQTRTVSPEHFKDFRLTIDVFRKSTRLPVLGAYREDYAATLVPNAAGLNSDQLSREAKKRFASLAGKEFAVVSIDGVPVKANIVSGALEGYFNDVVKGPNGKPVIDPATGRTISKRSFKTTPAGAYRLDALTENLRVRQSDGSTIRREVANPWVRSNAYNNSQMFWALWIKGGYFIHSTPHYGELGQPASMGCIRQSFPDAMELFQKVVAENYTGLIRIHTLGSSAAVSRLREIVFDPALNSDSGMTPLDPSKDMNWLLAELATNSRRIREAIGHYGSELNILGHAWIDADTKRPAATTWPHCGDEGSGIDCFKPFGMSKPRNSAN